MVPDKLFGVLDVKTNRLVKYVLVFFLGQSTGIVLHVVASAIRINDPEIALVNI